MDRNTDIRQSSTFRCKKWTLFTFVAIAIVLVIIMASLSSNLLDTYINENYPSYTKEWKETVKSAALVWVWVISGLAILFHLVGLMGAYKEHYCMTVTYAVLITLTALGSIVNSTKNGYYWFETVLFFIICGLTYVYAYDLRRIRLMQFSSPAMVVIGGAPTTTIVNMGPTQYAPNQYAPGQYAPGQYAPGQYAPGQYAPGQAFVAPQYSNQYGQPSMGPTQGSWTAEPENKTNY